MDRLFNLYLYFFIIHTLEVIHLEIVYKGEKRASKEINGVLVDTKRKVDAERTVRQLVEKMFEKNCVDMVKDETQAQLATLSKMLEKVRKERTDYGSMLHIYTDCSCTGGKVLERLKGIHKSQDILKALIDLDVIKGDVDRAILSTRIPDHIATQIDICLAYKCNEFLIVINRRDPYGLVKMIADKTNYSRELRRYTCNPTLQQLRSFVKHYYEIEVTFRMMVEDMKPKLAVFDKLMNELAELFAPALMLIRLGGSNGGQS